MDWFEVVACAIIGFMIGVVTVIPLARDVGYKAGQIDAVTGNVYYCLDNRFEWQYNENPVDELKCEAK